MALKEFKLCNSRGSGGSGVVMVALKPGYVIDRGRHGSISGANPDLVEVTVVVVAVIVLAPTVMTGAACETHWSL